jgi:hypothetical protein
LVKPNFTLQRGDEVERATSSKREHITIRGWRRRRRRRGGGGERRRKDGVTQLTC